MALNFVSAAVPAAAARFLTPARMGLLWIAATEAVQWAQSELSQAPPDIRKKEALEFALASYALVNSVLVDPEITRYVKTCLLPGMIDGCLKAFNVGLWFETSKPISVGGAFNPAPSTPGRTPSPPPAISPVRASTQPGRPPGGAP